ncbi:LOW QUALITY PROTEIN: Adhesive plaque matrix protein 2 [Frankliniella fusca]|uniref:Adhesive plaque matrix protein 2 n=1 Tax=Frankliniella fusca TaxID=407009 RepID=A0AAE1HIV8_9NEOP|nr:LOW QUALITY PROTEIN: Adhesive plaque matrix protein 2 [Frankliniella fusca]
MGAEAVPLRLDYDARAVRRVVQGCAFGWVAVGQFCVTAVEDFRLSWADAETECRRRGGHLASIPDQEAQRTIDDLLTNSPGYSDHNSYWVGASDVTSEGDFRWTDSLPFSYTNWFPGWTQHGGYNRQPNDDGFSAQDCVEVRRAFLLPPPGPGPAAAALPLDTSFRWNDRDCSTRNHFLCERPRDAQYSGGDQWSSGDCTRTVTLTREAPRTIVTSPGFPRAYPDEAQCDTDITAPPGYRLVLDFEEFVMEKEPYCSYDHLTIREDDFEDVSNSADLSLHPGLGPPPTAHQQGRPTQAAHPNLATVGPAGLGQPNHLAHPNQTGPAIAHHQETAHLGLEGHVIMGQGHHRYCGDWSEKLKLLRYASRGPRLRLRFVSDYSHHFGGFKARVSAETADHFDAPVAMECSDGRLHSFNSSCFLVVSFPQVTWQTARQVCHGLKAELAEVYSSAEQDFVVERIRHSPDYTTTNTYWLGGMLGLEGRWQWITGQPMAFTGWIPSPSSVPDPLEAAGGGGGGGAGFGGDAEDSQDSMDSHLPSSCLGLQWLSSPSVALPSGLYWRPRKCSAVGGYVCRRQQTPLLTAGQALNSTLTVPGDLSSPGYPSGYPANLDYQVRLVGPPQTRVVVRFARVDLEAQAQCLYDFIELVDGRAGGRQGRRKVICGQHHSVVMDRFDFVSASNEAVLRFHSDYSVSGAGFLGHWYAVDVSGCPQRTLSAREGELTSPFYPHKLMPDLHCTTIVRAPAVMWCMNFLEPISACLGLRYLSFTPSLVLCFLGRRVWLEFSDVDLTDDGSVWVDLGAGRKVVPTASPLSGGVLLSVGERLDVVLNTAGLPRGRGFRAVYRAVSDDPEEVVVQPTARSFPIRHLNFPAPPPVRVNFVQRFIAPLGTRLQLQVRTNPEPSAYLLHQPPSSDLWRDPQLYGVASARSAEAACPGGAGHLEVRDSYADTNGSTWILCEAPDASTTPFIITSYLNTLQLWQRGGEAGVTLNATIQPIQDEDYRVKLVRMSNASWSVESCSPNPCQNDGKCLVRDRRRVCECKGHFTGLLCGLTDCDLEPCVWGKCILTPGSFRCACAPHYKGALCNVRAKPCNDNPCEGRGECHEKGDTFHCRCHAWWEGPKCERRMSVPFKPLSERMLQEPFWLGLITVTAVLGVIGLFWCAKRHFPEKLEKLLAEEADRNRSGGIYPSRGSSLRDQLSAGAGTGASHSLAASMAGGSSGTGGGRGDVGGGPGGSGGGGAGGSRDGTGPQPPRSLFGRLGIRKPSILSLTAASPAEPGSTARTFSLDDLLRPPPGRTPSPRKKRNNSTPTRQRSAVDAAEKKQILQQLVSGSSMDGEPLLLDSLGGGDANHHHNNNKVSSRTSSRKASREEDVGTCETSFSIGMSSHGSEPPHKLEKKVTFARLLNKVSAEMEMSSGSERERGEAPWEAAAQPGGSPPHSTSSNPGTGTGSDSLSSLDASAGGDVVVNRRPTRLLGLNLMRYCDQDAEDGAATSDDSSHLTPATSSSGAPDSPPLPRSATTTPTPGSTPGSSTIEVTVLDPLSACQQRSSCGAVILLEVPSSGSRNLSPIREVPTPRPTPIPSPILPRSPVAMDAGLLTPAVHKVCMLSDQSGLFPQPLPPAPVPMLLSVSIESPSPSPSPSAVTTTSPCLSPTPSPSPCSLSPCATASPNTLVIPELRVEQPSPTRSPPSWSFNPGSPPPQRSHGGRPQDVDSPMLPFITVTCSTSEADSDVDVGHQSSSDAGIPGMCYLSPFSMCSRADRIASESNLSSSGYSSMASPGPSRCGSSNPLSMSASEVEVFQAEPEEGGPPALPGLGLPRAGLGQRLLRSPGSPSAGVAQPPPTRRASEGTAVDAIFYPTLRRPMRGRSDSETLSDDAVMESQDEGFATDTRQSLGTLQPEAGAEAQPVAPPRRVRHCGSLDMGVVPILLHMPESAGPDGLPPGMTRLLLPAISIDEPAEAETLLAPCSPAATAASTAAAATLLGPATELEDVSIDLSCGDLDVPMTSLLTVRAAPPQRDCVSVLIALVAEPRPCPARLQLPSIVVEGAQDAGRCLSPVSSRSESPLSDLPAGCERFSPAFYGRQLPFTDSDGLYDAPSSAGSATVTSRKSASGRRRERRSPTKRSAARSPARSPPGPASGPACASKLLLDVPEGLCYGREPRERDRHSSPRKPSPKRRARNAKASQPQRVTSSSSDESLNSIREVSQRPASPAAPERLSWSRTPEPCSHPSTEASGEETGEDATAHCLRGKPAWEDLNSSPLSSKPHRKISRLKTIGHQIRFLRRLEKSLSKRRQRMSGSTSPCDSQDSGEEGGVTAPLLPPAAALPVVITPAVMGGPGPGPGPGGGATTPTSTSSASRARHHRLRKQVAEPLLSPRDRMTRSFSGSALYILVFYMCPSMLVGSENVQCQ